MGHHEHDHGEGSRRALAIVLALTASFTVVEIVGGLLTGSLALLADAGHMLSDNLSLGIALFAEWLAQAGDPEQELWLQAGGDPRGPRQRRDAGGSRDLDLRRGLLPL
jgi:Co/Zn/Cd efflux system component